MRNQQHLSYQLRVQMKSHSLSYLSSLSLHPRPAISPFFQPACPGFRLSGDAHSFQELTVVAIASRGETRKPAASAEELTGTFAKICSALAQMRGCLCRGHRQLWSGICFSWGRAEEGVCPLLAAYTQLCTA